MVIIVDDHRVVIEGTLRKDAGQENYSVRVKKYEYEDILHDKSKVVYTLLTLYFGSEI